MKKIDMKEQLKSIYSASARKLAIIEVPEMNYLKIDGRGKPSQTEFQEAAQTLFPIALSALRIVSVPLSQHSRTCLMDPSYGFSSASNMISFFPSEAYFIKFLMLPLLENSSWYMITPLSKIASYSTVNGKHFGSMEEPVICATVSLYLKRAVTLASLSFFFEPKAEIISGVYT